VGDLQDGTFFRRVRIQMDGRLWEIGEFNFVPALEQVSKSIPTLDEAWVGVTKIPILGTIRVGNQKIPQGLEGDMISTSRDMTFLEQAVFTDAFFDNFGAGILTANSALDDRVTWQGMLWRPKSVTRDNTGAAFGDGAYAYTGRLTFLPVYENEGRFLIHVGGSATWRNAENPDPGVVGPSVVRFRARPQMRDAIGDYGNGVNPGNSSRWVDTGSIIADSASIFATEFLAIAGPLSFQAEAVWTYANNAVVNNVNQGNLGFSGYYVQVSYFLTGEHREYDRRFGRLGAHYIPNVFNPFWFLKDENGRWSWNTGAWELAARWSHLSLDDGLVQGGQLDGLELGLNWYLNNNMKVQFEYLHNNRYHKSATTPNGGISGNLDGFGIRTQLSF
jgi:phosphate-selective porin OprO/OprP